MLRDYSLSCCLSRERNRRSERAKRKMTHAKSTLVFHTTGEKFGRAGVCPGYETEQCTLGGHCYVSKYLA